MMAASLHDPIGSIDRLDWNHGIPHYRVQWSLPTT